MMKKMISLLPIILLSVVIMTGCSQKQDYINVIPADAYIVGSADLAALVEKSGLLTESKVAKEKVLEVLKGNLSNEAFQQVEKVLGSPRELGLDLEARLYMFNAANFPYPVWVCKVGDENKLTTTLNLLAKEHFCETVSKEKNYQFTIIDQNKIIAYNEESALITAAFNASDLEDIGYEFEKLMAQNSQNSIEKNPGFEKMRKMHGDINFMASLAAVPEIYSQQLKSSIGQPHLDLSDVMALGKLDFDKGKIALKFEYYTDNKEIQALLTKQAQATKSLNEQFLSYFPESSLAFASIGANGKAMYSLILDNKDLRDIMPSANSDVAKTIFDSFDGDISIAITDLTMSESSVFVAYAAINNPNILKTVYENKANFLSRGEEITQTGENEYTFSMKGFNVFFGIKNNVMYATNSKKTLDNICKDVTPSIKQAPYAKEIKGKNFFLVVNIGAILDLPMMKMLVGLGGKEYQMYYNLASKISYLEMSNTTDNVSEMELILKDKETNSLKQVVDFARQFIGL